MDNNWLLVLIPRPTNLILPTIIGISKQITALGWNKKYMDMTFIGTASSDIPLKNALDKNKFLPCIEYAMKRSMNYDDPNIKFKIVEEISPIVSEAGMGLMLKSTFMKHLAVAMGFTPHDAFFLLMAAPATGKRWEANEVRTAGRLFENPEDGKFHCNMNPSQWSIGIFNKKQPEILHAVIDLEMIVPAMYIRLEAERIAAETQASQQSTVQIEEEPLNKQALLEENI
jgi:hypothetical protein